MATPSDYPNAKILIIEDEKDLADLYARWLSEWWETDNVYNGDSGLETFDGSYDVILLDREMPGMKGHEVLDKIRETGYSGWIAMLTGVEPGFELVEMNCDEYITKPITEHQLRSRVLELLSRANYSENLQTYYKLVSKQTQLEQEFSQKELHESEEYKQLESEIENLDDEIKESMAKSGPLRSFMDATRKFD